MPFIETESIPTLMNKYLVSVLSSGYGIIVVWEGLAFITYSV